MQKVSESPQSAVRPRPIRGRPGATPILLLATLAACVAEGGDASPPERPDPVHVDSTFPIDEEIRRFREGIEEPEGLRRGAGSPEELVQAFLQRLEAADTTGLAELAIDRAEFAWFYYPYTMYVEPPYELPPGLVWYQLANRSSSGFARLVRSYGGRRLHATGFRCADGEEPHGAGRIRHGCTVTGRLPSGEEVEERLFGSLLGVGGRWKLVSFANDL